MSRPVGTTAHRGHSKAAALFLVDAERAAWHDRSLWFMRQKRDRGTAHTHAAILASARPVEAIA